MFRSAPACQRRFRPAVALMALTLAAPVACAPADETADPASATTSVPPTTTATGSIPAAVEAEFDLEGELPFDTATVNELIAFVEAETGRSFLDHPKIEAQSDADYEARLGELVAQNLRAVQDDIEVQARYYQVMAGNDQGPDELLAGIAGFSEDSDAVRGYYDLAVDTLFLPVSAGDSDFLRSTVVHELTHALDDQYVDLDGLFEAATNGEAASTEQGVIVVMVREGRAMAVEQRWVQATDATVIPPDLDEIEGLDDVPTAFVVENQLPYVLGPVFIEASGGPAQTWHYLEDDLPASTDMVMFPAGPGQRVEVDAPRADGSELDRGVFGALAVVTTLLDGDDGSNEALTRTAFGAAEGWAGGEAVIWGDATESCVRANLAADDETELIEMSDAFSAWADDTDGRTATLLDDIVQFTACAPYRS